MTPWRSVNQKLGNCVPAVNPHTKAFFHCTFYPGHGIVFKESKHLDEFSDPRTFFVLFRNQAPTQQVKTLREVEA
jgi:hypothetical protein